MTPKAKGPRFLPLGAKDSDWEYLSRQRRTAWFGLYAAAGRLLATGDPAKFQAARTDLKRYRDRLISLGVKVPEDLDPVEAAP